MSLSVYETNDLKFVWRGPVFDTHKLVRSHHTHNTQNIHTQHTHTHTHTQHTHTQVVLLGESSVGKSSLVLRFVRGQFVENSLPTVGAAFLTQTLHVEGRTLKLEIWDTAGQEKFAVSASSVVLNEYSFTRIHCTHIHIPSKFRNVLQSLI